VSATGRSDVRDPDDFYATPAWCTDAILPHLPSGGRVLDPGCGTGAILRTIMATAPFVHADLYGLELHEGRADEARRLFAEVRTRHIVTGDFLKDPLDSYDLIVGNPPFTLATEFVEKSLALVKAYRGTVAMLLRLAFLETAKRQAFHVANPADVFVLSKRPSFTPDGKADSCAYAWFVWGPGRGGRWQILPAPERT